MITSDPESDAKNRNSGDCRHSPSSSLGECRELSVPAWSCRFPTDSDYSLIFNDVSGSRGEKTIVIGGPQPLCDPEGLVIGRGEQCDIVLQHESSSRTHALIVYTDGSRGKEKGLYLIDCSSTNGTFANKFRCEPWTAYILKQGYIVKFGLDINFFIVQCPKGEEDAELNTSFTEMRRLMKSQKTRVAQKYEGKKTPADSSHLLEDSQNLWGQDRLSEAIFVDTSMPKTYELKDTLYQQYPNHPLDVIQNFFALKLSTEPEYKCQKVAKTLYSCELKFHPFTTRKDSMIVNVTSQTSDSARSLCALEACKVLDAKGLMDEETLTARVGETVVYSSDSDEDEFIDQTGRAKAKRQQRLLRKGYQDQESVEKTVGTFDSYLDEYKDIVREMLEIKEKLMKDEELKKKEIDAPNSELDAIENYMNLLQQGSLAPQTRRHYKLNLQDLELKKSKTESYLELSKPFMMTSDEYASILENPFEFTSKSQTANKHEAFNLTEFHEPENDSNLEQSSIIQSDEDQRAAKCGKLSPIKQAASKTNNIICVESKSPVGVSRNNCDESSTALIHEHSDSHTKDSECETKYSTWQPPVNQKGDGFTHLNEKYGY